MNRHPWRTRVGLLAFVNAVAAVFCTLGFSGGQVSPWTAAAVAFVALLADLGIVTNGEQTTTPVDDPLGADLLPLLPFRKLEDLLEAAGSEDLDRVRELLGQEVPH